MLAFRNFGSPYVLAFFTVLPIVLPTSYRVRVICDYIVRLEISAAENCEYIPKRVNVDLKTFGFTN